MTGKINSVHARQILDSRGNPTVEAEVVTEKGVFIGMAPSGASTGTHEVLELRDGGHAFDGVGVTKAVSNANLIIAPKLVGKDCTEQEQLDNLMIALDGTKNKAKLGANAIVPISIAIAKAGAASMQMPLYEYLGKLSGNKKFVLPVPQLNVINGGKHARRENDIQETMIMPAKAKTFSEAMQVSIEVYHVLKKLLRHKFGAQGTLVGDEGGFVPNVGIEEKLGFVIKAVEDAGHADKVSLALDSAASEFYHHEHGFYALEDKKFFPQELVDYYAKLCETYKIISLEDAMYEEDWDGWSKLTAKLGKKIQIVGDDLLVTNVERIKKAVQLKACNSLLLKVNQIGTVTESIKAAQLAKQSGWTVVVSHRSGETEDTFIADLAVGLGAGQCKFGGPCRSERTAKYNQLLRIEEALGKKAVYGNTQ